MTRIAIRGGTTEQKRHVRSSIRYAIKKLCPRIKDLEFQIYFIEKMFSKEGIHGDCDVLDWETGKLPKEYKIRINSSISMWNIIATVMHEMVHVKQWARGEMMEYTRYHGTRWKGEFVPENTEYWDQPWEIEAYGKERGLSYRYLQSINRLDLIDKIEETS